MQVKSMNGNRTIKLTKSEHDKLLAAQTLLAEIGDIAKDERAIKACELLDKLTDDYPAPEPKKQGTLT